MSEPSNILQRQKSSKKLLMMFTHQDEEQLTRQFSNISNDHGGEESPISIPFVWESQPGTPKVRFKENSLPPLTPPPSYYQNATKKSPTKINNNGKKNSPKSSLLKAIMFPKRSTRNNNKGCVIPPPESPNSLSHYSSNSSSSSSSWSPRPRSYSVPSSPMIHSRKGGEDEDLYDVPGSSLCFGNARSRGCYSSMFKKVLLGEFM